MAVKYRIQELIKNSGCKEFAPQVKESFFSKWKYIKEPIQGFHVYMLSNWWITGFPMRTYDTIDEAKKALNLYKECLYKANQKETKEIINHDFNH